MKRLLATAACLLVLGGCAVHPPTHGTPHAALEKELDAAVKDRPAAPPPPASVSEALIPPIRLQLPPGATAEPRFNLVVNAAPANQVLMAIVSGTRYNMLVHPGVSGNVSVNLNDVTVIEALEAIRDLYGYQYRIDGNRILVEPPTLQSRVFQVNYLATQRRGSSELRVTSSAISDSGTSGTSTQSGATTTTQGGANRAVESSRVTTTSDNDFWRELTTSLRTIVGTEGGRNVVVNPNSGVLVVRAMPDELAQVAAYLRASQIAVERQVMLEAKILEVQLSDGYQAGINWAAFNAGRNPRISIGQLTPGTALSPDGALAGGVGTTPGGGSTGTPITATTGAAIAAAAGAGGTLFGLALQTSNFAALLSFLESQGTVHVLSSPRIATINNQKAVLKVGDDELFVTNIASTTTTGTSTTTTPSVTLQSFFSGIALDVTPRIDENDNIILHVHPSVSQVVQVDRQINVGGTVGTVSIPVPKSSVSETDSIIRARDGQIVALGGLMRQSVSEDRSGVPGASDKPFIGSLFRQTNQTSVKRELVILLKPTLINSDQNWAEDIAATRDRVRQMGRGYSYGGKTEVLGTDAERDPPR